MARTCLKRTSMIYTPKECAFGLNLCDITSNIVPYDQITGASFVAPRAENLNAYVHLHFVRTLDSYIL